MNNSILIVEDDLTFATMLKTWLSKKGFIAKHSGSNREARKLISTETFNLVLCDLRLPDEDGLSLLSWMRENSFQEPFIIMTSYAEINNAVEAMKSGASDYISKPFLPEDLLKKLKEALDTKPSTPATKEEKPVEQNNSFFLEGNSDAARQLYNYVDLVAPTPMSVLINGASGTGKEYVAHRIHQLSKRKDQPFVAIDCGAIPKELAASEFFGHIKGSFTGAIQDKTGAFVEANGGTLFLDEIGNLSYEVQVQLLRAIQERKVRPVGSAKEIDIDIRLVSATNENLNKAIEKGLFREDLFHRINEFTLHMPPLKDRGEDIMLFANLFLDQSNKELERDVNGFDPDAIHAILQYPWPGNLRQLKNVVKRATLIAKDDIITTNDLNLEAQNETSSILPRQDVEKQNIIDALIASGQNKSKAALMLGIDRKTLYNKLKHFGL